MSDTERPPMPPQPITTRLSQSEIEAGLLAKIANQLNALGEEFRAMRRATDERFEQLEARIARHSDGARELGARTSSTDLEHEAKLAEALGRDARRERDIAETRAMVGKLDAALAVAHAKVDKLEAETAAQTATLARVESAVTGFFKDPKVLFVGKVVFVAAVALYAFLTAKGLAK